MAVYTITVQQYSQNDDLITKCTDWTLFNNGDGVVIANNFPIQAGQTFGVTANEGETTEDIININFVQPFTIANLVFVKRIIL
jgi:hypothetical protein